MSTKEIQTENDVKDIKVSDQICEKIGINVLNTFDFNDEEFIELLKKCKIRERKAILNSFNAYILHQVDVLGNLRESFTKIESDEKHDSEISKLMKSIKKGKKTSKGDDDTNSEENDSGTNTASAVNKPEKCHEFVKDFMVSQGYETSDEWSPNQIRTAMNAFVNKERQTNPDKINVKPSDGEEINKKIFNIYGPLETIIENCIKNIKEDISIVEKSIKEKKKDKPEADSTAGKEITYMQMWVDKYKDLTTSPKHLQFTDFMKYSPYCKAERNPLEKAKKKPPTPKSKASDEKKI